MLAEFATWVCRTPQRLAVAAVTALVVVLVVGSALFGHGVGAEKKVASPAPTVTSAEVPDASPYVAAAVTFVRKWSRLESGESDAAWLAALKPLTTTDLSSALQTTDPSQLPGVAQQGEPVVRYVAQTSALVSVPLADGSSVLVTVVSNGTSGSANASGMLVSDVQPNAGND
jgi:hypothetical protein